MNRDKIRKLIFVLLVVLAITAFSVGKLIICALAFIAIVCMYMMTGGGDYNERNLYDKKVEGSGSMTIPDAYEVLKDIETPFGKCWMTGHGRYDGRCLVFGPTVFKDYILVGRSDSGIELSARTDIDRLEVPADERWHLENVLDTSLLQVTPGRYSSFVAYKEAASVVMDDLASILKDAAGGRAVQTNSLDQFTVFHYNSSDTIVRDLENSEYARTSAAYDPLSVIVYDMDGNEVGSVSGNSKNEGNGFLVMIDGQTYGTLYRDKNNRNDAFRMQTDEGEVRLTSFQAVRRANVSSNYIVTVDGKKKAIMACSARIDFEAFEKTVENDVIVSFDDEELLLYILLQEFITTHNRFVH